MLVAIAAFSTYWAIGKPMTAEIAFTSLALLDILVEPCQIAGWCVCPTESDCVSVSDCVSYVVCVRTRTRGCVCARACARARTRVCARARVCVYQSTGAALSEADRRSDNMLLVWLQQQDCQ